MVWPWQTSRTRSCIKSQARSLLSKTAIGLDPRYADAYADLAMSEYFVEDETGDLAMGKAAEQAAQKSVELDPHLAMAYATRGFLRLNLHFDWVGAESDYRQALALEPANSRVLTRYTTPSAGGSASGSVASPPTRQFLRKSRDICHYNRQNNRGASN
jgi:hypothetical protein